METTISFLCKKYANLVLRMEKLLEEGKIEDDWIMLVKRAITYSREEDPKVFLPIVIHMATGYVTEDNVDWERIEKINIPWDIEEMPKNKEIPILLKILLTPYLICFCNIYNKS